MKTDLFVEAKPEEEPDAYLMLAHNVIAIKRADSATLEDLCAVQRDLHETINAMATVASMSKSVHDAIARGAMTPADPNDPRIVETRRTIEAARAHDRAFGLNI